MKYAIFFVLTALFFSFPGAGYAPAAGPEAQEAPKDTAGTRTGPEAGKAELPPPVDVPDECYCAECGMYVLAGNESFASEIIFRDGKVRYFCDLGDMMIYYDVLKNTEDVAVIYVRDHVTKQWGDGRTSFYLTEADVISPMRFGYLAFKEMGGAQAYRLEHGGGKIYTFEQMMSSRIFRR